MSETQLETVLPTDNRRTRNRAKCSARFNDQGELGFESKHAELEAQRNEGADPEDTDEYRVVNIFWMSPKARWSFINANAPDPRIGTLVSGAMTAIERDNPSLQF